MQRRDEQEQRCRRAETPRQVSWTRHRRSPSSSRRLSPWEARPDPCYLDLLSLTRIRLDAVSHLASPLLPPIHPPAPGCIPCSRSTLSLRPGPPCRSPGHPRRQARSWTAPQAGNAQRRPFATPAANRASAVPVSLAWRCLQRSEYSRISSPACCWVAPLEARPRPYEQGPVLVLTLGSNPGAVNSTIYSGSRSIAAV